jgi:hypothetical protein
LKECNLFFYATVIGESGQSRVALIFQSFKSLCCSSLLSLQVA